MSLTDPRFFALQAWLRQFFDSKVDISLICGDASFRRYFRITHDNNHYILADSPPQLVPIAPFVAIAKAYHQGGLSVPKVLHACAEQGFVLQSDLGEQQLLALLTVDNVASHYRAALMLLPQIARVTQVQVLDGLQPRSDGHQASETYQSLPLYDAEFVQRELAIFSEWLLGTHLKLTLTPGEQKMLDEAFECLTQNALCQPKVGMHRDFHSRNLIVASQSTNTSSGAHTIPAQDNPAQDTQALGIVDFQDAVIGPISYDAVSLLRDCYIKWPQAVIAPLIEFHYQECIEQGLLDAEVSLATYTRWFDLMGMQRHIKAAGIFARLNYRDNKPNYMADIPLTLSYLVDIGGQYPELTAFSLWIQDKVLPLVNAQHLVDIKQ
ncbi:aminoglycoside phosphotransferase [Shewanella denitrificans OS217]|uniref:Aminoglycoside phosphotransferase n=1 Tax=Shewanella denitrificans (strain OS217 / ATCC BAA-1090 / DSM 15013) TaxID=318161 RepID=Q12K63_SHEDO|nr:phosphotransferase [Shewanella denitrificans]ABE56163.1 aminoglycoside phosphotransferase [Shewanella denitrificans OS217]